MSEPDRIPPAMIQRVRESGSRPRNSNKLIDRDFAFCLHNCLIAYPETTGADLVDIWDPLPLIPQPGTPTSQQVAALWEADNRYGGVDRQFLEYRTYLLCTLMRQFPNISAGWFRQGSLVREEDNDDFDVKDWFPTTQELEELDEAYIAAQLGEQGDVERYRACLADMVTQYPRLDEREMAHLHRDRVNSRHSLPGPKTLQLLDTSFHIANADYDIQEADRYATIVNAALGLHPDLSLDQLMRLQTGSVYGREFSGQPADEVLRVLDELYLAGLSGDRARRNGYLLLSVETLCEFPHLTDADLKALHSVTAGNVGQQ